MSRSPGSPQTACLLSQAATRAGSGLASCAYAVGTLRMADRPSGLCVLPLGPCALLSGPYALLTDTRHLKNCRFVYFVGSLAVSDRE